MPEKIITKVAAFFKYPNGKPVMKALKHGDSIILEREPHNPFDPNAIKIMAFPKQEPVELLNNDAPPGQALQEVDLRPVQLGYVPAPIATRIKNCHIIGCIKSGPGWDEITIEIA